MKFSFFAVPFAFASALFLGCAANVDDAAPDGEEETASADENLTTSYANRYFGSYGIARPADFVEFERLVLNSDGIYTANVQAPPNVRCFRAPCTVAETGRWNAYAKSGGQRVSLRPTNAPLRVYVATQNNEGGLILSRKGKRSTLNLDILSRCAAMRCTATSHCALLNGAPTCAPNTPVANPCIKTGCSGEICADSNRASACVFRPEYACYQQGECKRQSNGLCGFTKTAALTACLDEAEGQ